MRNNHGFSVRSKGGFKDKGRFGSHSITHNLVISSKCLLLPGSFFPCLSLTSVSSLNSHYTHQQTPKLYTAFALSLKAFTDI